jgi:hypothetical protein
MDFSMHPKTRFTDFVEIRYGRYPLRVWGEFWFSALFVHNKIRQKTALIESFLIMTQKEERREANHWIDGGINSTKDVRTNSIFSWTIVGR